MNQYRQFQASDIKGLLQTLRWANFFLALVIIFLTLLGAFNSALSLSVNLTLLYSFGFLFAAILALYELHMKKLGARIRRNFGFLYTYIGRSLYIFLYILFQSLIYSVATILFSPQAFLLQIVGIVAMADAFINVFVILVHPAFRKGELKLTDDPSVGYSAGDNVLDSFQCNS